MTDIVEKLQNENKELKKLLYEKSDYIKKLNDNKHDLFICKIDFLSIRRGILKCKKIKQRSDSKIKEIKKINLSNTYNEINKQLLEIENEINEWYNIPKCIECDSIFDNNNICYTIKKYDLTDLCKNCSVKEIKKVLMERKFIRSIDEKHINNKIINKLISKSYYDLTYYNDIYIDSQKEQISLYSPEIVESVGLNPKNDFDKYKINNLCYRSSRLLELFDDKIKFINIPESDLARMGKTEFQALCDVLYDKLGGYSGCEDIIRSLNMNNNEDDYIPEPPDSDYEDECTICGTTNLLPGNSTCITCKFDAKPQTITRIVF
jgi:hypothetical protein